MFRNINNNKIFSDSSFWTSLFVIAMCLLLFIFFPSGNGAQKFTGQFFFLVLIPALYIKYILKKNLSDFGLNVKNIKSGLFWGVLALAIVLLGMYSIVTYTTFVNSYNLPGYIVNNFWYFLLYELVFVNISLLCFEFFLRGFVLFTMSAKFSYWSIFIQSLLYLFLLIYKRTGFELSIFGLVVSTIMGFIAWKTRSIVYSYAIILVSSIIIDAYLIYSIK